jgi:peroxiredoxin
MSVLLALLILVQSDSLVDGTQLNYQGKLVAEKGDAATAPKNFRLSVVVARTEGGATAYWISEEQGRGGWSWRDRFGTLQLNEKLRAGDGSAPTVLYQREEGNQIVPILLPLITPDVPLVEGATWTENRFEHTVAGTEKIGGNDAWRIEVQGPIGRKRIYWLQKSSSIILANEEVVFIGQGEKHVLRYDLVSRQTLDAPTLSATRDAFDGFARLRQSLGFEPQSLDGAWTQERLGQLRKDLPDAAKKAEGTLLATLAQAAQLDAKTQKDRANAVGALHEKLVGQESPKPPLETAAGEKFSWDDMKGKVAVLHFWEYRDTPLEEPYGQVAYLDYLLRMRPGSDLRVFGVVADERVMEPQTRRAGIQSARKLHSFMNLSYPLLIDGGDAIKKFGDPRIAGAKLPLFIVIDRNGKVIHYHVGHYEVNRDRGLEELEAVIKQALDNRG